MKEDHFTRSGEMIGKIGITTLEIEDNKKAETDLLNEISAVLASDVALAMLGKPINAETLLELERGFSESLETIWPTGSGPDPSKE